MTPWQIDLANIANLPQPEPIEAVGTGRCAYCGDTLPLRRKKYCTDEHMRTHHNIISNAARAAKGKS